MGIIILNYILNFYFSLLSLFFIFSFIISLVYWCKLIYHLSLLKNPKYWNQLYLLHILPRGKKFFKFYFGKEDFGDSKIKKYKQKFRFYFFISICFFLLILFSIIVLGIIGYTLNK